MKRNQTANYAPAAALLFILGSSAFPNMGATGEDSQTDRESRRIEGEARRQQEMAVREIEGRERAQAEALRAQLEAIRRMEATRSRIEANSPQPAPQSVEQVRIYSYPFSPPNAPPAQTLSSIGPEARPPLDLAHQDDPVRGMSFATLSERLGSYFGTQSGVLVVRAGANEPFGLQDGDVILSIDGRVPAGDQHAAGILRSYQPGERVKLRVQRGGRSIDIDTTAPGLRNN